MLPEGEARLPFGLSIPEEYLSSTSIPGMCDTISIKAITFTVCKT